MRLMAALPDSVATNGIPGMKFNVILVKKPKYSLAFLFFQGFNYKYIGGTIPKSLAHARKLKIEWKSLNVIVNTVLQTFKVSQKY